MTYISLELTQILAVTWVWQRKIYPKLYCLKSIRGIQPGRIHNKQLHQAAYNQILLYLFSDRDAGKLTFTSPGVNLFSEHAYAILKPFCQILLPPELQKLFSYNSSKPEQISLEEIILRKKLQTPTPQELSEAEHLLKTLLTIDQNGELEVDPRSITSAENQLFIPFKKS